MAISTSGYELLDPFVQIWNSIVLYLPGILAALAVIIVGYFVGVLLGYLVTKIIEKTKIDHWMHEKKMVDAIGGLHLSRVAGQLVKWWVFVAFLTPAANIIYLDELADILTSVALWVPHLIAGIVIMLAGLLFADFLANSASHAKKLRGIQAISTLIKILTIIFFAGIALREIGFRIFLAEMTILMITGGVILIFVIGFGIGMIKPAEEIIRSWLKKL
ncbi:hypothetical protein J4227_01155 [Candidatus Woesearchaeota archaeon]|nr:hypothetical protein [Candidatus Woesearchaeota archaeon]